jgi:hypothetical protein
MASIARSYTMRKNDRKNADPGGGAGGRGYAETGSGGYAVSVFISIQGGSGVLGRRPPSERAKPCVGEE